jgi:signal peptidase II
MEPSRTRWIWVTLFALALDRATKYAVEVRTPLGYHKVLIQHFFTFVHASNPGLAFGIFADSPSRRMTAMLSIGTIIICALLVWLLVSGRAGGTAGQFGVALILGGAAGNLLDRLMYSRVTDFLDFQFGNYHWPAFNVADSAIMIGAVILGIELLFFQKHVSPELPS